MLVNTRMYLKIKKNKTFCFVLGYSQLTDNGVTISGEQRRDSAIHIDVSICQVASVVSNSVWPHWRQPTRLPHPWDSPGKNTGVGCHFLLQCMKVKSESEDTQSCPTLCNPMDCSLPGSSIHGIFQARVLEWGAIAFSCIYLFSAKLLSHPGCHTTLSKSSLYYTVGPCWLSILKIAVCTCWSQTP